MRRIVAVEKVRFNYETESWESKRFELPYFNNEFVLLTPKNLLTKDDIWINRPELLERLDTIAQSLPNESLRAEINNYLYSQLSKKSTDKEIREAKARTLERYPELIEHYIRSKEDTGEEAESVSAARVKQAEWQFVDEVRELRGLLRTDSAFYNTKGNTYDEARARVMFLKDVIDNKDGYKSFYTRGQLITREEHFQILYRLTWFETPST
jgi:hypothetical protein